MRKLVLMQRAKFRPLYAVVDSDFNMALYRGMHSTLYRLVHYRYINAMQYTVLVVKRNVNGDERKWGIDKCDWARSVVAGMRGTGNRNIIVAHLFLSQDARPHKTTTSQSTWRRHRPVTCKPDEVATNSRRRRQSIFRQCRRTSNGVASCGCSGVTRVPDARVQRQCGASVARRPFWGGSTGDPKVKCNAIE